MNTDNLSAYNLDSQFVAVVKLLRITFDIGLWEAKALGDYLRGVYGKNATVQKQHLLKSASILGQRLVQSDRSFVLPKPSTREQVGRIIEIYLNGDCS